jgi:hypothetical protein
MLFNEDVVCSWVIAEDISIGNSAAEVIVNRVMFEDGVTMLGDGSILSY